MIIVSLTVIILAPPPLKLHYLTYASRPCAMGEGKIRTSKTAEDVA